MSSIVKVDTIQENTSANGITVDGLNIKDSKLTTSNSVVAANITADAVDATKIADDAISEEHLDVTAITGHSAETSVATDDLILISDTSASGALKKMTRANFVSGIGGTNTPAFSARLSSGLTLNDATTTDVVFQTEFFDVGSCYNNSTGVFTVPSGEGGKYCISVTCTFQDGQGNVSDMLIYMNSTIGGSGSQEQVGRAECTSNGNLHTNLSVSYTTVLALSAADTIKIQAYADTNNSSSSSLQHGARNTVFSAFKIIE